MITREQQVEESIQSFVRDQLVANGYGPDKVKYRDAFPTLEERATELKLTQVSTGFTFDNGGRPVELGSDLKMRIHTIEFFVFGVTMNEARNVASVIRAILEDARIIPLRDIGAAGRPVIDQLVILDDQGVAVTRQVASDPRPWDHYVFTTTVKVEDTYYPSLVN